MKDGVFAAIGALFLQRCLLEANDAAVWKAVCTAEKHCFQAETQFWERSLRLNRQECFFVRNDVFASNSVLCLQRHLQQAN